MTFNAKIAAVIYLRKLESVSHFLSCFPIGILNIKSNNNDGPSLSIFVVKGAFCESLKVQFLNGQYK